MSAKEFLPYVNGLPFFRLSTMGLGRLELVREIEKAKKKEGPTSFGQTILPIIKRQILSDVFSYPGYNCNESLGALILYESMAESVRLGNKIEIRALNSILRGFSSWKKAKHHFYDADSGPKSDSNQTGENLGDEELGNVFELLHKLLLKYLKGLSFEDRVLKAIKRSKELKYLPYELYRDVKDEGKQQVKFRCLSLDQSISPKSEDTFKDLLQANRLDRLYSLLEKEKRISKLMDILENRAILTPKQRQVVQLRFLQKCTIKEIAKELCISSDTVKQHWQSARKKLEKEMKS